MLAFHACGCLNRSISVLFIIFLLKFHFHQTLGWVEQGEVVLGNYRGRVGMFLHCFTMFRLMGHYFINYIWYVTNQRNFTVIRPFGVWLTAISILIQFILVSVLLNVQECDWISLWCVDGEKGAVLSYPLFLRVITITFLLRLNK